MSLVLCHFCNKAADFEIWSESGWRNYSCDSHIKRALKSYKIADERVELTIYPYHFNEMLWEKPDRTAKEVRKARNSIQSLS